MKKNLVLLAVLIGAAGLYFYFQEPDIPEGSPKYDFRTAEVQKGPLLVRISATGVVEPNSQVEIKSKASGRVLKFAFEEGDFIKKGTLLLQLDKSDELRSVARAEADLQSAVANFNKAESSLILQKTKYETELREAESQVEAETANLKDAGDKLKRQEDLFQKQVAAQETLDSAQTTFIVAHETLEQVRAQLVRAKNGVHDIALKEQEIELAKAEVARAEIALAEAREKLEETEIFAPVSGVLTEKLVEEGQIISSGISNVSGGTSLAKVADLVRMFITADVDETDIGSVKTGQEVAVATDAFPGKNFTGKVKRIAPQGKVENSITIFKVKIEIVGSGKDILKPMMSANVDIITNEKRDVLFLPREAVWVEENKRYAAIFEDEEPKKALVTIGIRNLTHVEIQAGLDKGQTVILDDWETVEEQMKKNNQGMSTVGRILWIIRSR